MINKTSNNENCIPSPNTSIPLRLTSHHSHSLPHPSIQLTIPSRLTSLNAALINARSLRNKTPSIISLMTDHDLVILFIAVTWLSPLDSPHIAAINTPPYCFIQNPRDSPHPGGGTGLFYKSSLTISNISYHSFSHSEALSCAISSPFFRTFNISIFYRPTSPTINSLVGECSLFIPTITSNTIYLTQ